VPPSPFSFALVSRGENRGQIPAGQQAGTALHLRRYFYSGWAFLIPYLAAYLLYLWLKWPANSFSPSALGNGGYIPALLHVYWVLHLIHLILAVIALRTWWHQPIEQAADDSLFTDTPSTDSPSSVHRPPSSVLRPPPSALRSPSSVHRPPPNLARLWPVLPWILLALIFAIPGVYLEWPSDPWEHFRRITEWSIHPVVGAHSAGYKSFYFFAYSLYELAPNLDHFTRLSSYSTGISLLLAWQYYRLARAVGLDQRWAFLFVLGNTLTFGNVCFSFYKYYGLSSTMYAQLGAVALTRIALETAKDSQFSLPDFFRRSQLSTLSSQLVSATCLLALIAFNHVQGLGIAGLSAGSIIIWRLLKWKRSTGWWLLGGAIILSAATVLWWPRHPTIDAVYRPGGWLNAWYGFNFFTWPSPAADRAMQILGLLGLINLGAGVFLLRRNHVVAWLTALPILALALPVVALPFANKLAASSTVEIITFHRLLFAMPSGLALMLCISQQTTRKITAPNNSSQWVFAGLGLLIMAVVSVSPQSNTNNRLWNLVSATPQDLQLQSIVRYSAPHALSLIANSDGETLKIDTQLGIDIREVFCPNHLGFISRQSPTRLDYRQVQQRVDWLAAMRASASWISRDQGSVGAPYGVYDRPILPAAAASRTRVVAQPTAVETNWLIYSGHEPEITFNYRQLVLSNPHGASTEIFSPELIPIYRDKRYKLSSAMRQIGEASGIHYLAVAWFDSHGALLLSNGSQPNGAGEPSGWSNGTYSYYGLNGQPAQPEKTHYSVSFGLGEIAAIPSNATFIRVGALINYRSDPRSVAELSDVILEELPIQSRLLFEVPDFRQLYSPASQAAWLSGHWSAQYVPASQAGSRDLEVNFTRLISPR